VSKHRLPTTLVNQYSELAFGGTVPVGGFHWRTFDQWAEITRSGIALLSEMIDRLKKTRPDIAAIETEFRDKMAVNWRAIGYGPLAETEELRVSDPGQASLLEPYLREIGLNMSAYLQDLSIAELEHEYSTAPVPIDRGKGAPYWFKGTDGDVAISLVAITLQYNTLAEIESATWDAGQAMMPSVITSYIRVQSSRKPRPVVGWDGTALFLTGEESIQPKVRRVQAVPFIYNVIMAPIYAVVKKARRAVLQGRGAGKIEESLRLAEQWKYVYAADVSTFDDSVAEETETAFRDYVLRPVLSTLLRRGVIDANQERLVLDVDKRVQGLPILSPPVAAEEGARIYKRQGGQRSGEKLTSEKGTIINYCRAQAKARFLGSKPIVEVLGDDTLLFSDEEDLGDRWNDLNPFAGFKEEIAPSPTFLMKHVPGGFGYVARMIMATIQKEAHLEPRSIAQAAMGISARKEVLKGVNSAHPERRVYDEWLQTLPLQRSKLARDIAETIGLVEIGEIMAAGVHSSSTYVLEEVIKTIDELPNSDTPEYEELKDLMSSLSKRRILTYAELKEVASREGRNDAKNIIKQKSYTIRH
jgi:hypothetical protein